MIFIENIEKRDLVKISVSPRREHDFKGFERLKIYQKTIKNRCKINSKKYRNKTSNVSVLKQFWDGFWEGFGRFGAYKNMIEKKLRKRRDRTPTTDSYS